ncbi:uncharacterized protein LOC134197568 isoform X2 [Corticium candelabrum]|uniref:uncharacterized protein LOC134197568 isoform X2 n=1 Tax=Corticium candelabrum TaxID=121492 RepID=UPI002E25C3A9|nr:uncharacterized protein LOC134197568 isoform X2 [Corticium candelabrum]
MDRASQTWSSQMLSSQMYSSKKIGMGTLTSALDLSDIIISCCLETQSNEDFMIMKMKLKSLLRQFSLVHLLDIVKDTFGLFYTVFSTDHPNLTDLQKLELLKEVMKATGKHHMVDKVSQAYKQICQMQCLSATDSLNSRCPQLVCRDQSGDEDVRMEYGTRDDQLNYFSVVKDKIGRQWTDLGRELEITEADIEDIQDHHNNHSSCCFAMLIKWERTNGQHATKLKLEQALTRIQRKDIVDMLRATCSAQSGLPVSTPTMVGYDQPAAAAQILQNPTYPISISSKQNTSHEINHHNVVQQSGATGYPMQCSDASHKMAPDYLRCQVVKPEADLIHLQQSSSLNSLFLQYPLQPSGVQSNHGDCSLLIDTPDVDQACAPAQVDYRRLLGCYDRRNPSMIDTFHTIAKNRKIRHLVFVAVGRTGVGKTTSMNEILGTITREITDAQRGTIGQGMSETQFASTWTRSYSYEDSTTYKLSFIDTPGLGDNSCSGLTDEEVCKRICWATNPITKEENTQIMMVYFSTAPSSIDAKEIESIKMLEAATGLDLFCVVLTMARSPITSACLKWDECKQDIKDSLDVITEEFQTDYINEHKEDDDTNTDRDLLLSNAKKEINADADGLPKKRGIKEKFLQIFWRHNFQKTKKQWYEEKICRQNKLPVPVVMLENAELLQTEKCNVEQLFKHWVELLGENSPLFLLMTCEEVMSHPKSKFYFQEHKKAGQSDVHICEHICGDSSTTGGKQRRRVQQNFFEKLIELLMKFLFDKEPTSTTRFF